MKMDLSKNAEFLNIMSGFGHTPEQITEKEYSDKDKIKIILNHRKEERNNKMFLLKLEEFEDENGFCPLTGKLPF